MTDTLVAVQDEIDVQRKKLVNTLGKTGYQYYGAPYPGDCYIFDVVLGIDPRLIPVQTLPHNAKSYEVFLFDNEGKKVSHKGRTVKVKRKFTKEQKEALKEWYPLLSAETRGELR